MQRHFGWAFASAIALGLGTLSTASAADLAARPYVKAPPPVVAPAYNWSGWYLGLNGGYGWGRDRHTGTTEFDPIFGIFNYPDFSYDTRGGFVGLQTGYNWQSAQWVYGVETDIQFADIKGDTRFNNSIFGLFAPANFHTDVSSKLTYFGTARVRAGYLIAPAVLAYVTGGFAYGEVEARLAFPSSATGVLAPGFSASDRQWQYGYTVGAGVEGKVTDRISLKAEYLYVNLNSKEHTLGPIVGDTYRWQQSTDLHTAKVGLNFHLMPSAVVARY